MRLIFAGTPSNAATALRALVEAGHNVVGVLTRKDAATGRSGTLTESVVAATAGAMGIPVFKANKIEQPVLDWIEQLAPELGVIVAYGCILQQNALKIPSSGWINLHYSMLPKYPGASPVQQALLEGESRTGVSVFELDEGIDSGAILAQRSVEILPDDNSATLMQRLSEVGSNLLVETLQDFARSFSSRSIQEIDGARVITRKINRKMARLSFDSPAIEIVNKVRAMYPDPVAWFESEDIPIRVLEAKLVDSQVGAVGIAKMQGTDLVVGCQEGTVTLVKVQPAGKKAMSGADWFRGLRRDTLLFS